MQCLDSKIQLFCQDISHILKNIFHVHLFYQVSKSKDCCNRSAKTILTTLQFIGSLSLKLLTNKSFHSLHTMCKHVLVRHTLSEIFSGKCSSCNNAHYTNCVPNRMEVKAITYRLLKSVVKRSHY